jgi:hypothetical protein
MHALPPRSSVGLGYRNGLETTFEEEDKDQSKGPFIIYARGGWQNSINN